MKHQGRAIVIQNRTGFRSTWLNRLRESEVPFGRAGVPASKNLPTCKYHLPFNPFISSKREGYYPQVSRTCQPKLRWRPGPAASQCIQVRVNLFPDHVLCWFRSRDFARDFQRDSGAFATLVTRRSSRQHANWSISPAYRRVPLSGAEFPHESSWSGTVGNRVLGGDWDASGRYQTGWARRARRGPRS